MSESDALVVDGTSIRFDRTDGDRVRVLAQGPRAEFDIGSLEPVDHGPGYFARRSNGELVTRPSQWGGHVSARFGSKELAVRALLEVR